MTGKILINGLNSLKRWLKFFSKTCAIPEKMLIFARKKDIRLQQLSSSADRTNIDMVVPLDGIMSADALAVDPEKQMIYWTDIEGGIISRSRLNGSEQQLLVSTNLRKLGEVDYLNKNDYAICSPI